MRTLDDLLNECDLHLLNMLERYRYSPSALRWQEIREVRNQITHE